jgi:hypothetical protein
MKNSNAETQRRRETLLKGRCYALLLPVVVLCLSGCLMSESSFFREDQVVEDSRIEGTFVNTNDNSTVWNITRSSEAKKRYKVQVTVEKTKFALTGTLFRLDDLLFLDLFPLQESPSNDASPIIQFGRALMSEKKHLVVKVELGEKGCTFWCPAANATGFAAYKAPELKQKMVGKMGILIFPSSTEESQKYLSRFAKDASLFNSQNSLTKRN